MAGRPARPHAARMLDVRRALPALPVAAAVALHAIALLASRGVTKVVGDAAGVIVFGLAIVVVYRAAAGWSERARRQVGYVTSVVLGLVTGGVLAFAAFGTSLCSLWGETCTPDELALANRLLAWAVVTVVGLPSGYAVLDLATVRRR